MLAASLLPRFVADVQVRRGRAAEMWTIEHIPDGSATLAWRWRGDDDGDLSVRGPSLRTHHKRAPALPLAIIVRFRPGYAYPFFGRPVDALAGGVIRLDELWPEYERVCADLAAAARRGRDPVPVLASALAARMHDALYEPPAIRAVREAIRRIDAGASSIDAVVRELGVSERTLRRAFVAAVGLTPKEYTRVARLQRAIALAGARDATWSEVARAAGYFDQAHLIREFRALTAKRPTELAYSAPNVSSNRSRIARNERSSVGL